MSRLRGVAGVVALLVAACATVQDTHERIYSLTVVQRYGSEELGPDSLSMPDHVRHAAGGVLGAYRGAVQLLDSTIYVLDRSWYKIVGFRPDGTVKDVILGGNGEGPGEFRLPVHIGAMPDGDLVVLDYELRRLSFFRPGVGFVSLAQLDVPGALRLQPAGNLLWISRALSPGSEAPRAVAVDRNGERVREAPPMSAEDRPFGTPVNLAAAPDGALILPQMRPGLWQVLRGNQIEQHGHELFPGLAPPIVEQEERVTTIGTPEAWTAAVASMLDGRVLVWYGTATLDEDGFPVRGSTAYALDVYSADGERVGVAHLPEDLDPYPWSLYISPVTGHLLIGSMDPYPSVVELRLEEVSR